MLTNRHPAFLAALWMSGALLSFMLMAISGRELSHSLTTYQILFFRSVIGVLVISILLSRSGWQQIRTQRLKTHWLRNIAHYAGQYGWFYGLAFIPLAEVIAIEFTTPVWTALLAFFLLKERLTGARLQALVLGIAGLLLILRPGAGVLQPAAFAVLGGALGYAFSYIQTKSLTRTDTPLCILFYMTLMQLPFGLVPSVLNWTTPAAETLPWILLVGITAMSAHFCMAHAFRLADATVVVPMDFLRLPLIAVVGYLFYQESIDLFVLAGAVLMFSGNLLNLRAEYRRN
ncbi:MULTISPECIES: DMT family transporter [Thalassolituus]|jgi:drug/metabolite transporter (DMT)-like permease|uniref:DMT family transporter n=1 Tax=Thalassolituus TaxID=187492 RepID=UPI000C433FDB|nr:MULTISPECIES: DMT family transporter [Thalassolituus]MCB2386896.1 DMT family transporter [Thalassolituus alkanivorans]MCB2422282.1 DMT family transporter [Thalassolituus alkanivorans]PIQ41651.1 MAG: EamA family transporter [Thalassolituus sp. CG17_big_fil_post_rev_8_21_14_2_50_53_8]